MKQSIKRKENGTEKGEKKRGRKKKYKEIPVWNATSAMKTILENQIYSKAKYAKMFTSITVRTEENGMFSLEWAENNEEREKYCRKYYGKEFICTDQTTWGIKEIIEGYVDQECIENGIFRGTKEADYFSALPQFHWTDQKLRVHFFLCFGALVIEEVLNKHLKDDGLIYTKSKMLDKLSEIHDGWIFENDKSVKRVTEKLDPLHQQLWESVLKLKEIANC